MDFWKEIGKIAQINQFLFPIIINFLKKTDFTNGEVLKSTDKLIS